MPLFPPLSARDPHEHHRAATPLELLFDLVSVIAIAAVTAAMHHEISHGHGFQALPSFGFLFIAIWWYWINFTWFASAFDSDDALYRFLTMIVMTGALIFAGGVSTIFKSMDFSWGLAGWVLMRVGMITLWLRVAGDPTHRRTALRYAGGIGLAQLAWIALYVLAAPGTGAFYAGGIVCFLFEFAVPMFAEKAGKTPWHRHHIIERYGLLTIIVLGEILLSVAQGFGTLFGEHATTTAVVSAFSGIVIVFCVWWLYFAEDEHLTDTGYARAFLWGYGHVFFFASAAMLGAGLAAESEVGSSHSVVGYTVTAWFIGGPLALGFFTLWAIRDRFHAQSLGFRKFSLAIMAGAFVFAAAVGTPSWGFAILSVVTLLWRVSFRAPKAA